MISLLLIIIMLGAFVCLFWERADKAISAYLPAGTNHKLLWQITLFASLFLLCLTIRLYPFAFIVFIVALGVIGNSLYQARQASDDILVEEDVHTEETMSPIVQPSLKPAEAYEILGLEEGAAVEDVESAYKRLMARLHPDAGGTNYLASRINEARSVLKSYLSEAD